ncbi:MAG: alpha/beta hydrolase [Acidimicrobiia bacterium]
MWWSRIWPPPPARCEPHHIDGSHRPGRIAYGLGLVTFPPPYQNFIEGFVGVVCSDSDNPDDHSFWSAAGIADASSYFGRIWTWISSPCAVWTGADADRYTGPWDAVTANPVLVVRTLFDPATRYQGAQLVRSLLPASSLLTVDGWGHTSLFLSACADQAVSDYLLTAVPPADGTVCFQDFGPFDVVPAAELAARESGEAIDPGAMRAAVMDEVALSRSAEGEPLPGGASGIGLAGG